MPVPRIFQFWDKPKPPADVAKAIDAWAMLGTGHRVFSEDHATRFIARTAGGDAAKRFAELWHPALKSDIFRLYALYDRGGVYADADSLPQAGITDFLDHGGTDVWASAASDRPQCVTINWFLAAPAKSELIAAFIDHVLATLDRAAIRNIFWIAGPGALTRFLGQSDYRIRLLPSGLLKAQLFQQFDAGYKTSPRNWRVYESRKGMSDDEIIEKMLSDRSLFGKR